MYDTLKLQKKEKKKKKTRPKNNSSELLEPKDFQPSKFKNNSIFQQSVNQFYIKLTSMKSINQNSFLWHLYNSKMQHNQEINLEKIYSHYQSFMECQDEIGNQQMFMQALELSAIINEPSPPCNNKQSVPQAKKNKKSQLGLLGKIIHQLVRQNLIFKRQLSQVKERLEDVIISIQNNIGSRIKNFTYFSSLFEESNVENMTKYIKNTIQKIKQNQKQNQNISLQIKVLKISNVELEIKISELNNYIKQRKQYSEKLKQIIRMKQKQIQEIKISRQNQLKLLNQIQTNCDLKYRNRNDLIIMIKSLSNQMIKHQKDCKNMQNIISPQNIDKFLIKSVQLYKKPSIIQ